jgi:hypothetical protein
MPESTPAIPTPYLEVETISADSDVISTSKIFDEGLQAATRVTFPNTNKSSYSKVSVLMVSWEDEDPNLPLSIEMERLIKVQGPLSLCTISLEDSRPELLC